VIVFIWHPMYKTQTRALTASPMIADLSTKPSLTMLSRTIKPTMEKAIKKLALRKKAVDVVHVSVCSGSTSKSPPVNWLQAALMKSRRLTAKKRNVRAMRP